MTTTRFRSKIDSILTEVKKMLGLMLFGAGIAVVFKGYIVTGAIIVFIGGMASSNRDTLTHYDMA